MRRGKNKRPLFIPFSTSPPSSNNRRVLSYITEGFVFENLVALGLQWVFGRIESSKPKKTRIVL
jgi:hypothetical protein